MIYSVVLVGGSCEMWRFWNCAEGLRLEFEPTLLLCHIFGAFQKLVFAVLPSVYSSVQAL